MRNKGRYYLAAAALSCLSLTAAPVLAEESTDIAVEKETGTTAEETEEFSMSNTDQVRLIVASMNSWKPKDGKGRYAVTDLDGNGRFEIISANVNASGTETTSQILEVNAEGTKLEEFELPWAQEEDGPDLVVSSTAVYIDSEANQNWYIFTDTDEEEDGSLTEHLEAVSLKDGAVTMQEIAVAALDADGAFVSATDADGAELTEDEYQAAADSFFADFAKGEVSIKFISTKEHSLTNAPMEQILELAAESVAAFEIAE